MLPGALCDSGAANNLYGEKKDVFSVSNAAEARAKRAPSIAAATSISGWIAGVSVDEKEGVCVFQNLNNVHRRFRRRAPNLWIMLAKLARRGNC
jgi:hypothetical protein